jgi:hypothetical protein
MEYIGLLARKVAGYNNSFLKDEQRPSQLPAPEKNNQTYYVSNNDEDDDVVVIDAEYQENEPRRLEFVPQERFSDFFKNYKRTAQDFVYVKTKR